MLLGDVFLCPAEVRRRAAAQDMAFEDFLMLLVAHGILHLLGYDHDTDPSAERMEDRETALMAEIGRVRRDGACAGCQRCRRTVCRALRFGGASLVRTPRADAPVRRGRRRAGGRTCGRVAGRSPEVAAGHWHGACGPGGRRCDSRRMGVDRDLLRALACSIPGRARIGAGPCRRLPATVMGSVSPASRGVPLLGTARRRRSRRRPSVGLDC